MNIILYSGAWDTIINLLNSTSVITTIVGFLVIGFAKCIIKIFNMGVKFKTELATKEEQRIFEDSMRKDLRNYCMQIQATVMDACSKQIERELRDIDEIKAAATEIKVLKAELESKIDVTMEKYDEIKSVGDTVRALSNKVARLEYTQDTGTERRTEK